jgi:Right handed beta helix region
LGAQRFGHVNEEYLITAHSNGTGNTGAGVAVTVEPDMIKAHQGAVFAHVPTIVHDLRAYSNHAVGLNVSGPCLISQVASSDHAGNGMKDHAGNGMELAFGPAQISEAYCTDNLVNGVMATGGLSPAGIGVHNSHFVDNTGRGIEFSYLGDGIVTGNCVTGNGQEGIHIANESPHCTIVGNYAAENGQQGNNSCADIQLETRVNSCNVQANTCRKSRIYDHGKIPAGGVTSTTIQLADGASTQDDFYTNMYVCLLTGAGSPKMNKITGYVGSVLVGYPRPQRDLPR